MRQSSPPPGESHAMPMPDSDAPRGSHASQNGGEVSNVVSGRARLLTGAFRRTSCRSGRPSRPLRASLGRPSATLRRSLSLLLVPTLPLYVPASRRLDLPGRAHRWDLCAGLPTDARPSSGSGWIEPGRRGFLLVGAAIYVLASLGYLADPFHTGLLLWRVFHAMGLATFSTAAASLAGDLAPPGRRGTTMGVFSVAQAAALTVGPGVGQGPNGRWATRGLS